MKRILKTCVLIGLAYLPNAVQAFEAHPAPNNNLADHALHFVEKQWNNFQQNGVCNIFVAGNSHTTGAIGLQSAYPLFSNQRSLYRLEGNIIQQIYPMESAPFWLQWGVSGRYIVNPNFILGGYLFHKLIAEKETPVPVSKLFNIGLEFMQPRYGSTLTVDSTLPLNIFSTDEARRFYQASIKLSSIKPQVLDIFCGVSLIKHPYHPRKWVITLPGIKRQLPIKRWNANKWCTLGFGGTYTQKGSWLKASNFGFTAYLQINFIHSPQNSLKDYLRMPIDRFFAIPFHPGALHRNK